MKLIYAFILGALVTLSAQPTAAPVNLLLREVNLLWRYVESGPDNADIRAFNAASALRDRRVGR